MPATSYINLALRPGADPGGAGDNSQVLIDALAEADAVYIPGGRWRFSQPVPITESGKRIFGDGDATVLLPQQMPGDALGLFVVGPPGLGRIVSGVTLERFAIRDFEPAQGDSLAGIDTCNADRVTVAWVTFDNAGTTALRFGHHDDAGSGIDARASHGHRAMYVRVLNMHPLFAGDARSGIEVDVADDVTLHGFEVRDCSASHGIRLVGARGARLFDGRVHDCATGVRIQGLGDGTRIVRAPTGWDVGGVDVSRCSGSGFDLLNGASRGRIHGCTVRDALRGVYARHAVPAGAEPADFPSAHDFALDDLILYGNTEPFTFAVPVKGEEPAEKQVAMMQGVVLADASNVSIHRLRTFGIGDHGGGSAAFGVRMERIGGLNNVTDMEYRAASETGMAIVSRESLAGSTVVVRGGTFHNPERPAGGGPRQNTLFRQVSGSGTFVTDVNKQL